MFSCFRPPHPLSTCPRVFIGGMLHLCVAASRVRSTPSRVSAFCFLLRLVSTFGCSSIPPEPPPRLDSTPLLSHEHSPAAVYSCLPLSPSLHFIPTSDGTPCLTLTFTLFALISPSSARRITPSRLVPPTATTLDTPSGVTGTAAGPAATAPAELLPAPAAAAAAPAAPFADGAAAGIIAPAANGGCGSALIPAGEVCRCSFCCSSGSCCWLLGADNIVVDGGIANAAVNPQDDDEDDAGGRRATAVTAALLLRRIIFLRLLLPPLPPSPKPPSPGAATNPNPEATAVEHLPIPPSPPPPPPLPLFLATTCLPAALTAVVSLTPPRENAADGKGTAGGPAEGGIDGDLPHARVMSPIASSPRPMRTPSLAAPPPPPLAYGAGSVREPRAR